jgi:hypothetical protein
LCLNKQEKDCLTMLHVAVRDGKTAILGVLSEWMLR